MTKNKKWYLKIPWAILISFFAFFISLYSAYQSNQSNKISSESNKISNNAIDLANKNFLYENRPYLVVSPKKVDGTENFFAYQSNTNEISIKAGFEIKNEGKFPAKNITAEVVLFDSVTHEHIQQTSIHISESAKILPDKLLTFELNSAIGETDNKEFVKRAKKDIELNIFKEIIVVHINYKSDIDDNLRYQTRASYIFDKNGFTIINLQEYD